LFFFSGDEEAALFLLKNKADIVAVTSTEEDTCLHLVARNNNEASHRTITQALLDRGADPNRRNSSGL